MPREIPSSAIQRYLRIEKLMILNNCCHFYYKKWLKWPTVNPQPTVEIILGKHIGSRFRRVTCTEPRSHSSTTPNNQGKCHYSAKPWLDMLNENFDFSVITSPYQWSFVFESQTASPVRLFESYFGCLQLNLGIFVRFFRNICPLFFLKNSKVLYNTTNLQKV